jgi:hypothetical protein
LVVRNRWPKGCSQSLSTVRNRPSTFFGTGFVAHVDLEAISDAVYTSYVDVNASIDATDVVNTFF